MEFKDKLQKLRASSNLTQEQLAEKLFVSRVTVSKWETGRGYPNLGSLKLMAELFGVSVDELLSDGALPGPAGNTGGERRSKRLSLLFGFLDFSACALFVLPVFRDRTISSPVVLRPLVSLHCASGLVRMALVLMVAALSAYGVLELALQDCKAVPWNRMKFPLSFCLSLCALVLFILTFQQNPALILILLLLIKAAAFLNATKSIAKANKPL